MTSNRLLSILLVLCILAISGAQLNTGVSPNGLRTGMEIQWSALDSGPVSNVAQQGIRVFETEGDLQRFWTQTSRKLPQAMPYRLDWNTEKAVAVFLGQRTSGGFEVYVQRIDRINASIARINAIERKPQQGRMTTQAITSPWVLIRVKRNAADFTLSVQPERQGNWYGGVQVIPGNGGGYGGGYDQGGRCQCTCPCCRAGKCTA
ncbi:MAG: protease complex subunit PrcB family protein, partial [Fimbriimonas sp.]